MGDSTATRTRAHDDETRRRALVRWIQTAVEQLSLVDAIAVSDDVELRIVLARDQALDDDLAIPVEPAPPFAPIDPRDVIGDGVRILRARDNAYVVQRGPVREIKLADVDDQCELEDVEINGVRLGGDV